MKQSDSIFLILKPVRSRFYLDFFIFFCYFFWYLIFYLQIPLLHLQIQKQLCTWLPRILPVEPSRARDQRPQLSFPPRLLFWLVILSIFLSIIHLYPFSSHIGLSIGCGLWVDFFLIRASGQRQQIKPPIPTVFEIYNLCQVSGPFQRPWSSLNLHLSLFTSHTTLVSCHA